MPHKSRKRRVVFSLKWKTVILLSLVLIIVNTTLTTLSYQQIEIQYKDQRKQNIERQRNELNGLISDSYRDLEYFSSFVHILASNSSIKETTKNTLKNVFEDNEILFDLEWDMSFAIIYDEKMNVLYNWRGNEVSRVILRLLLKVKDTQAPAQSIQCIDECTQYLATPILLKHGNTGYIVLGRPLTRIVVSYERITGSDIAILSRTQINDIFNNKKEVNYVYKISIASNSSKTSSVIDNFMRIEKKPPIDTESTISKYNNDIYELTGAKINSDIRNRSAAIILIDNITEEYTSKREYINLIITSSITGFIVSELLLLILLWNPMARIRHLSEVLPVLSQGRYSNVREQIDRLTRGNRIPDEIDILSDSTYKLSEQLESLGNEIDKNTKKLEQQRDALLLERDFNTDLLDTAQAIIITHDNEGTIISINNYGLNITEYEETEILGKDTSVLFGQHGLTDDVTCSINNLRSGEQNHFQHESTIRTHSNKSIFISWYHSRVSHTTTDNAIILSIGLDVTARHQAEERLGWIADHDPLTKLYNRRRFQLEFDRILRESIRYHRQGALLFIDLDHFKLVNDTNGHHAGDQLLKAVAESMASATRDSDILARLGGDEFALVIPESNKVSATKVARKIMNNLSKIELPGISGIYKPSGSIGITVFPEHGTNIQELMGNADISMYLAKQNGRGICHMYSINEQAREQITKRIQWKQKIDDALEQQLFYLNYQPIFHITSKTVSHYEVLIRLKDTDGSIIGPAIFIPEAEQTGQINTIDRLVIELAAKKLNQLNERKISANFSINLSGRVIDDPQIVSYIKQCFKKYNINPSQVIFEVTETAAVADIGSAKSLMQDMIDFGCQFALDDFGVGFASFYYLKQLPVTYVKIDGAFIRNLPNDEADQLFVKALKDVASGLNKKTIAEFVEDEETLKLLSSYGIDYAQGYHIGKPSDKIKSDTNKEKTSTNKQSSSLR